MRSAMLMPLFSVGLVAAITGVAQAQTAAAPQSAQVQPTPQGQSAAQALAAAQTSGQVQTQVPLTIADLTAPQPAPDTNSAATTTQSNIINYFANWFDRVAEAQASQPHWMTPVVTVTPRLEEEVRYDQYWEKRGNGSTLDIFDSGKGLELIPTETNEILINPPAYQYKGNTAHPANGWLDDQFLVIKQRLFSANEDNGNYIVTAFLGVTAPSGNSTFTNNAWTITPTIAGGKGWGDFDIQATLGIAIPVRHQDTLGKSLATNVTFQYHLLKYFWPEFEVNYTYWLDGDERGGKNQVLLTPGLVLGRFEIYKRIKFIIGGGYQFAVSPKYVDTSEQTPAYNHAWILTTRVAF